MSGIFCSFRNGVDTGLDAFVLPVSDATYMENVSFQTENAFFHVAFYDGTDETMALQPTGGTITFDGGVYEGQWLAPSQGRVVQAAEAGPNATFTVPRILGPLRRVRMMVAGITGLPPTATMRAAALFPSVVV